MKLVNQKHKALYKKAKEVSVFDEKLKRLVLEMKKLMVEENGIGLAAPQIGKSLAIFVINKEDIEKFQKEHEEGKSRLRKLFKKKIPEVFINPKIKDFSKEKLLMEEGCLSAPRIFGLVLRAEELTIEAQNENGKKFQSKAKGLLARVIQHETDHLNGILYIDKAIKGTLHRIKTKNQKLKTKDTNVKI